MRLWPLALLAVGSFVVQYAVAMVSLVALDGFGSWAQFEDDLRRLLRVVVSPADEANWAVFVGAMFLSLTQAAFLVPTCSPMASSGVPRSLRWTVISAAGVVAVLSALWIAAVIQVLDLYTNHQLPGGYLAFPALIVALGASWFYWSRVLAAASKSSDEPERAILRRLLGATGLIVAATIPLHVMARRKTDCYCVMGSFLTLAWGIASGVWLLGPWALGGMTRRMRRSLSGSFCMRCGHARGSIAIVACPECGHKFRVVSPSSLQRTAD